VLALLLNSGADYTLKDNKNNTILHMAADFGTIDTLRVLAKFCLHNVDPEIRNNKSLTATDIAQTRVDIPDGLFLQAFKELVDRTAEDRKGGIESMHVNELDIFEDAIDDASYSDGEEGGSEECFEDSLEYQSPYSPDLLHLDRTEVLGLGDMPTAIPNLELDPSLVIPEADTLSVPTLAEVPGIPLDSGEYVALQCDTSHHFSVVHETQSEEGSEITGITILKESQDAVTNQGAFSNPVIDSLFVMDEVKLEAAVTVTDILVVEG